VLRTVFEPKRDNTAGGWRKLHNDELHNLYCWPNTFRMIKSRRMILAGHLAHMEAKINEYRVFVESQRKETTWKT
jgi:hypothetical protein